MNELGTNDGASTSSSTTEYDLALASYDSLVQEYESNAQASDANIVVYEAKLIRAVCRVLNVRPPSARNALRPRLNEWLRVVGLSAPNIRHIELCGVHDVLTLIHKSEKETKSLAERGRYSPESKRRILRSCEAARNYLELLQGKREGVTFSDKQLSWSVKLSPSLKKTGSYRGTSADTNSPLSPRFVITTVDQRTTGRESPGSADLLIPSGSGSFPGSPAPSVGHSRSASGSGSLSVLSGRATLSPSSPQSGSAHSTPTMGTNSRVVHSISMQFDPLDSQRSPKLNRLNHAIPHKWHRYNKFRLISDQMCTVCQRPLGFGFLNAWEKCRSCKWKVHTQCKGRIGDTCGLTPDHLRQVVERMISQHNITMWHDPHTAPLHASHSHEPVFQYPPDPMNTIADSSSSTNSSAPSTPAALGIVSSPYNQFTAPARTEKRFTFPDTVQEVPDIVLPDPNDTADSPPSRDTLNIVINKSLDVLEVHESLDGSEGTVIGGDSTGSAGTEDTEGTLSDGPTHQWDRSRWNMSTIRGGNAAASWNEVTIPPRDIDIKRNEVLGRGRFGYVMKATYFGDVVAKIFTMDHVEESRQLDEFRTEVANFKNTRHDNIVLFMGCILQGSNRWCIVMNRINGHSIHKILHENGQKPDLALAHNIGVQICQGISYLHTKKILHKDLRTKNVFFEKSKDKVKVIITDFGITSMKRLRNPPRDYSIVVPQHWLVYQAPEIVASMATDGRELPFSEKSDAYSFGTIWFELLTCCFPFAGMHPDTVTYFVGRGLQSPIPNIKTNKEAKPRVLEILTRCWSFSGDDRPSFAEIDQMLGSLPRRRLDRSPSFPVIRSFESNF